MGAVPLYDAFSTHYDCFVNWSQRLDYEMSFIKRQLVAANAHHVFDTACGTGMHAIALAQDGYRVAGADLSDQMIEHAQKNCLAADCDVRFVAAGFGQLAQKVGHGFDALLCLGNSLPHVLTDEALGAALSDFVAVLRPAGLLLVQNRNFDAVMADRSRWILPQTCAHGDEEWIFVRFYDFNLDGTLTFNIVTLNDNGDAKWTQQVEATTLRPWLKGDLLPALTAAGFGQVTCYGDMQGSPFDTETSGNLILAARRN